jgi:hypothetical protein
VARKTESLEYKEPGRNHEAENPAVPLEPVSSAIESFSRQFATTVEHLQISNDTENRERRQYETNEFKWTKVAAKAGIVFSVLSLFLSGLTLWVLNRTYSVYRGQATIMATQAVIMDEQKTLLGQTLQPMKDQAAAAKDAAIAAKSQAASSQTLADETARTNARTERVVRATESAEVEGSDIKCSSTPMSRDTQITPIFINYGKATARRLEIVWHLGDRRLAHDETTKD